MAGTGQFRCIHCGDYFNPTSGDLSDYEEGYIERPDTCNECSDMINHPPHDIEETHSDADPGL